MCSPTRQTRYQRRSEGVAPSSTIVCKNASARGRIVAAALPLLLLLLRCWPLLLLLPLVLLLLSLAVVMARIASGKLARS